jgi:hypothetical protein
MPVRSTNGQAWTLLRNRRKLEATLREMLKIAPFAYPVCARFVGQTLPLCNANRLKRLKLNTNN